MTVISFSTAPALDTKRISALQDLLYASERESMIRLDEDHRKLFASIGRLYAHVQTLLTVHAHSMTADAATTRCRCRENPQILVSVINACSDLLRMLETRPLGPLTEALHTFLSDVSKNVNEHGRESIEKWVGPMPI